MPVKGLLAGALLLALVAYWPLRQAGAVYEDEVYLRPAQAPLTWRAVVAPRGLTAVTFRAQAWAQHDARASHAGNLALHLLVGLSLYVLATRWLPPRWAALLATIHLVHPFNSEAVAYLAQRAELLAALGTVWTVWALTAPTLTWRHGLVGLFGALVAVGGKELGVMALPLAGLCRAWLRPWRLTWRVTGATLAGALICLALVDRVLHVRVFGNLYVAMAERSPWAYLALQTHALWTAVGIALVPIGQTVDHDVERVSHAAATVQVVLSALVVLGAGLLRRRLPLVTLGVWWVVVALGPRFLVRIPEYLREGQLYTAGIGLWLILTVTLHAGRAWLVQRAPKEDAWSAVSVS